MQQTVRLNSTKMGEKPGEAEITVQSEYWWLSKSCLLDVAVQGEAKSPLALSYSSKAGSGSLAAHCTYRVPHI